MKHYLTIVLFWLQLYPTVAFGQCVDNLIFNGTFELDTAGQRITASGWDSFADPDLHSIDSEIPSGQWEWVGQLEDSFQGGNWQCIYGPEFISQTVSIEEGKRYTISFEVANLPITSEMWQSTSSDTAQVEMLFNNEIVYTSQYLINPYSWEHKCYTFIANASEIEIKFRHSQNVYLGLDNICLTQDLREKFTDDTYEICLGEQLLIELPESSINDYIWSNGDTGHQTKINEEGSYYLSIESDCGTINEFFEIFSIDCGCKLYVPNVFTPSVSLENNLFEIGTSCQLAEFEFTVYDRWGNQIFYSTNINENWDGSFSNQLVSSGSYTYNLIYSFKNSLQYQNGSITIIR